MIVAVQNVSRALEGEFRRGGAVGEYFETLGERRIAERGTGNAETEKPSGGLEVPGFGDMLLDVWNVIEQRNRAKEVAMRGQLAGIARAGGERVRVSDRSGGGEWRLQVHSVSYHYWGRRLGYACWDDAQFVKEYLRDNEYARVRNVAATTTVGWRAAGDYVQRKKIVIKAE